MAAAIKKSMPEDVKYSKKSVALVPPKPLFQNFEEASESSLNLISDEWLASL
jgi:hypothetical protein